MKTLKVIVLSLLVFVTGTAGKLLVQTTQECDATAMKNKAKTLLDNDFKYDSAKITRFAYKDKEQVKEIEVPLFIGEKYKFIFNTEVPENIIISIYDKPLTAKKRKLLYTNKEQAVPGSKTYTWEPQKSRKMYVNIEIPKSANVDTRGCVVFLLGYKI